MRHLRNPRPEPRGGGGEPLLGRAGFERARSVLSEWPGYATTPLRDLPGLAGRLGIRCLFYKDEGDRFGIGSFKALGGAYAVFRHLEEVLAAGTGARRPSLPDLLGGACREAASGVTVTAATDGNHGRSVAWGASLLGCRAVIYVPSSVSPARREAIAGHGARVVEVAGDYDEAVRACARDAAVRGRRVVTDTSYEGETVLPREVMQGYRVMVEEALAQLPAGSPLTHVFVQGGVGALPAAVASHLEQALGGRRPRFLVVEPESADCLYRSAEAGRPARASGDLRTVMGGLACGEPSRIAWEILSRLADDFLALGDEAALDAVRTLARGEDGDPAIEAGESGAAGVAAILEAVRVDGLAAELGLDEGSCVLTFGTEGAIDPDAFERIVGRPPRRSP